MTTATTSTSTPESERIADQIRRAFDGDAWHGDPLMTLLDGVTAARAAERPIPGAHSIWELVQHITFWLDAARRRLAGEVVQPGEAEQWPPVAASDDRAWSAALERLRAVNAGLVEATRGADEARLAATTPGKEYNNYVLLHGVVQHTLYHAGQIALLKKAAGVADKLRD